MVLTGLVRRNGATGTRVLRRLGGARCQRSGSRLLRRNGSSGESGRASCRGAGLLRTHGRVDGRRRLLGRDGARGLLRAVGRVDRSRRVLGRDGARGLLRVGRVGRLHRYNRNSRARGKLARTGSRDGDGRGIDRLGTNQGGSSGVRDDGDARRRTRYRRLRDIRRLNWAGWLLRRGRA